MVVVLERLGIPAGPAATATLLYRAGELWLPLALALALQARKQPRLRGAPARLPAIVTALTGLLSVASVIAPRMPRRFERFDRLGDYSLLDPVNVTRTLALVSGFVLLLLSFALWRRRWIAWWLAVGFSTAVLIAHVGAHREQSVAVVAAIDLSLLLAYRRRFRVRSDIPTVRRGLLGVALSLAFALAYGTAGFWLLDRREFGIDFSLVGSLRYALRLYFSLGSAGLRPRTHYAAWFLDSFTVIGIIAIAAAALSILRPVVWRARTLPQERAEAKRLIERFGDSSLDRFKATDDKRYFFARRRDAVIAYGLSGATAIVLGDPVAADDEAFRRVLAEFLDFTDANAWQAAFHQVPETRLAAYRDAGLATLKIGEEAIVDVASFSLCGNGMKSLRASINRLTRDGYVTRYCESPHAGERLDALRAVSDSWLSLPGRRERSFTLGRWDAADIASCPVMTVEHADRGIVAFVNMILDGVAGEATFDLMRHRADAPSGCMDLLLVDLIACLKAQGFERLSLGMAPWSEVGANPGARLLERGVGVLTPRLERFFSVSGLRAYKSKFQPVWEPRFLVYGSEASLPRVALSIVRLTEQGAASEHVDAPVTLSRPLDGIPLPPLARPSL
jgi:phosphatidylglycerol lysyltransferase